MKSWLERLAVVAINPETSTLALEVNNMPAGLIKIILPLARIAPLMTDAPCAGSIRFKVIDCEEGWRYCVFSWAEML